MSFGANTDTARRVRKHWHWLWYAVAALSIWLGAVGATCDWANFVAEMEGGFVSEPYWTDGVLWHCAFFGPFIFCLFLVRAIVEDWRKGLVVMLIFYGAGFAGYKLSFAPGCGICGLYSEWKMQ